ncbi:MAG: SAM-dependent methyltransferase [Candidatus Hydrothermarchaeaceae archaeon]
MIKKDYYYRKAKKERYRSRAAFKLKQLNEKFRIVKKGGTVLDLGAAPGGWMQVLREIVADEGLVLGVDLDDIRPFKFENIKAIKGDFTKDEVAGEIKKIIGSADAVVSDASPDISGVWDVDHFRSVELSRSALSIARDILKPGGNFLVKVFQGGETEDFFREVKGTFSYTKRTKPRASRDQSSEIYIVAKGVR